MDIDVVELGIDMRYSRELLPIFGYGKVSGTVAELGTPGPYRVQLFTRSGLLVKETWSGADGSYGFQWLNPDAKFFVVAFDHGDNPVNAAISDYVSPAPMIRDYRLVAAPQVNVPNPYDLTQWDLTTASAALDQVGIAGVDNTATTLTDATTTGQGRALSANVATQFNPGTHCWRAWVKKNPAASGFIPELQAVVDGSFQASIQLDLASGDFSSSQPGAVRDGADCGYPDWWIVAVNHTVSALASLGVRVFASRRLTLGGVADNLAMGSVVVGWVDILANTSAEDAVSIVGVPYV